ncbi:uncharacterized protein LOC133882733 [Alnus glutinosa]|uniref:uncharacterized protein LOC133882733 n=1 Tax=Alnus glutinosa TaxID=3517 RepID=UPI002D786BB0|nr:uncharacterized protein LOC133882733 [Alnus glutinosa]XP_062177934.1 uncharacterized protein LOC133882733 [Alnus glutinosa]XP_062177935.1 uncharacterized protein LOC133882733 [Alnus glutinosa]XP_062177936.1 uncharacterized protein LOC133882733 [Alnus glutinosa]
MSLSLLQGYSSAEEEEEEQVQEPEHAHLQYPNSSDEASAASVRNKSFVDLPPPSSGSGLPSALDVFSEISEPPAFLNNSVEEYGLKRDVDQTQGRHGGRRNKKEKKDLPSGAVVQAKAQLVGIHERVRSDIGGNQPPASSVSSTTQGGKRVATATNPNAEDAAELLRMCLQCGIPKTYSNARGMVCPVCGDRPPADTSNEPKKKGSMVKEKEKNKRMKGQSSHATWKSETEMHLRQQFD